MFKKIGIVGALLIVSLLAYAATKPDTFHVQRSTNINVPQEKVFAIIDDFSQWLSWSPWEKLDPAMKKTLRGPANGKGAISEWDGNSEVGTGRTEITESIPSSKITMTLDMFKPFEAHNIVEFTLTASSGATHVTWAMHGPSPYIAKVMSLFIDCDKMVGKQFEEGLANLKTIAERA